MGDVAAVGARTAEVGPGGVPVDGLADAESGIGSRPQRVRVVGDLFHGRVPEGAVYVGRAAPGLRRSPFANTFRPDTPTPAGRAAAARRFREWICAQPARARAELAGRDLACWCPPGPCHGDELLQLCTADVPSDIAEVRPAVTR